jgi:hypothetical protein
VFIIRTLRIFVQDCILLADSSCSVARVLTEGRTLLSVAVPPFLCSESVGLFHNINMSSWRTCFDESPCCPDIPVIGTTEADDAGTTKVETPGCTMIEVLIPTRFLTTLAHLLVVVMLFDTYENNIRASLASQETDGDFDSNDTTCAPHDAPCTKNRRATPSRPAPASLVRKAWSPRPSLLHDLHARLAAHLGRNCWLRAADHCAGSSQDENLSVCVPGVPGDRAPRASGRFHHVSGRIEHFLCVAHVTAAVQIYFRAKLMLVSWHRRYYVSLRRVCSFVILHHGDMALRPLL